MFLPLILVNLESPEFVVVKIDFEASRNGDAGFSSVPTHNATKGLVYEN